MIRYGAVSRAGKVRNQTPRIPKKQRFGKKYHAGRIRQRKRYGQYLIRHQRLIALREIPHYARWTEVLVKQRIQGPGPYICSGMFRDSNTGCLRKITFRGVYRMDWSPDRHKEGHNTGPLLSWMRARQVMREHKVQALCGVVFECILAPTCARHSTRPPTRFTSDQLKPTHPPPTCPPTSRKRWPSPSDSCTGVPLPTATSGGRFFRTLRVDNRLGPVVMVQMRGRLPSHSAIGPSLCARNVAATAAPAFAAAAHTTRISEGALFSAPALSTSTTSASIATATAAECSVIYSTHHPCSVAAFADAPRAIDWPAFVPGPRRGRTMTRNADLYAEAVVDAASLAWAGRSVRAIGHRIGRRKSPPPMSFARARSGGSEDSSEEATRSAVTTETTDHSRGTTAFSTTPGNHERRGESAWAFVRRKGRARREAAALSMVLAQGGNTGGDEYEWSAGEEG